jgi:putative flippase GtrA
MKTEALVQFIRYIITGLLAAGLEYLVFMSIYSYFHALYAANSAGMAAGFLLSFLMNRSWSFKSRDNPFRQFMLTLLLFIINLGISNALIHLLSNVIGIIPQLSKLAVMAAIVLWNFILYKKVIYRK